jgi:cell division transport system permease protein
MAAALRYAFDEAMASLRRGGRLGVLSGGTMVVAFVVLGGFALVARNLAAIAQAWDRSAELSVYLTDGETAAEREGIERALASGPVVAEFQLVSKQDALARFKANFADLAGTIDTVGENPLPASIEVRLRPGAGTRANLDALSAALRPLPGVADVRYDREWLERFQVGISALRNGGLALGAVLAFAAALTVGSVVRLRLEARRDELEIMQLVGAPDVYISGPFVMEGVLQGGAGALVALLALGVAYAVARSRYVAFSIESMGLPSLQFLSFGNCALLVLGGMLVGCLGGAVASRGRV